MKRAVMTGRLCSALAAALAVAAVGALSAARANGPEIGRDAGVIFPVASDSIQLVSENVLARLPHAFVDDSLHELARGHVQCTYRLRNLSGAARTFEMAFLANRPSDFYQKPPFDVTIDGQPAPVTFAMVDPARWAQYEADPRAMLPTWQVAIAAHGEALVEIAYVVNWSGAGDYRDFHYHARPAALWAGRLERARIEFRLEPPLEGHGDGIPWRCDRRRVTPAGYTETPTGVVWELTDWEPNVDFRLWLECDGGPQFGH